MLDFLDGFNLIDRITGMVAGVLNVERGTRRKRHKHRGLTTLRVPRDCGLTGEEIETRLKRYGIPVHGRRVTEKELIFSVPQQQERTGWASYLLRKLERGESLPPAWAEKGGSAKT